MVELRERKTVRGQVTARLFQAIVAGELRPGDRIIETRLASQLGVGQSTLREALQDLEYRELVKKEANRGTYVTVLTSKAVKDMYAVRLELEPMAAELAKKHITNKHLAQLREMVTKMEEAGRTHDFPELLANDFAFHQLIWKLSDNAALERALSLSCMPLFAFYLMRLPQFRSDDSYDFSKDHDEHRRLIDLLASAEPKVVRKGFREILEKFMEDQLLHGRTHPLRSK
jgi:DNA-binding GntR family transcriptional regulator